MVWFVAVYSGSVCLVGVVTFRFDVCVAVIWVCLMTGFVSILCSFGV